MVPGVYCRQVLRCMFGTITADSANNNHSSSVVMVQSRRGVIFTNIDTMATSRRTSPLFVFSTVPIFSWIDA